MFVDGKKSSREVGATAALIFSAMMVAT